MKYIMIIVFTWGGIPLIVHEPYSSVEACKERVEELREIHSQKESTEIQKIECQKR